MFLQLADVMPVATELPGLITTSAMSVAIIQSMKNSNIPWLQWINQHSSNVNRVVGLVFAFASAMGLHYEWDGAKGTLLITGLTATALLQGFVHVVTDTAKSWSFNWIIYQSVKGRAADVAALAEMPGKIKPVVAVPPGVAVDAAEHKAEVKDKP